jgi:hypothetical protein
MSDFLDSIRNSLGVIGNELPKWWDDPNTADLRNTIGMAKSAIVPESPSDAALMAMGIPRIAKPVKGALAALSAASYSPDAEAGLARVGKGAVGFVRDYWPDAVSAVRRALRATDLTDYEHAVARTPSTAKVWTDNLADRVSVPADIQQLLYADPKRSFLMHTHTNGDVAPSAQDLLGNIGHHSVMELIASPTQGNPMVAFRKYQPIGKDYDQYTRDVFHHVTSPQVKDFLTDARFLAPDSLDVFDFAMKAGPHTYMRNLGLGDKIDYLYNDLGPLSKTNPNKLGDMLDAYWNEFLPNR